MTTGQRIREARKSVNISQLELGERLGVSQAMIAQYENGTRNPKFETLQKIASALEIDVTELLQPLKVTEIDLGDGLKQRKEIHGENGEKLTPEKEEAINKGLLLDSFDKLNDKGQQKAVAYVELLAGHPDYKKDKNA
jgi:transcriptional regulator with XRE-family HTH domain